MSRAIYAALWELSNSKRGFLDVGEASLTQIRIFIDADVSSLTCPGARRLEVGGRRGPAGLHRCADEGDRGEPGAGTRLLPEQGCSPYY